MLEQISMSFKDWVSVGGGLLGIFSAAWTGYKNAFLIRLDTQYFDNRSENDRVPRQSFFVKLYIVNQGRTPVGIYRIEARVLDFKKKPNKLQKNLPLFLQRIIIPHYVHEVGFNTPASLSEPIAPGKVLSMDIKTRAMGVTPESGTWQVDGRGHDFELAPDGGILEIRIWRTDRKRPHLLRPVRIRSEREDIDDFNRRNAAR